jgi:hypothetical protein
MIEDYDEKNKKTKIYSISICFCVFIAGSIISSFFFFLHPNNVLCDYTNNEYLCNKKVCNKGFFGENCLECKICQNGYCDGSGTNSGTGKCICDKGWSGKLCDNCDKGFYGKNCTKCDDCFNGFCNGSNTIFGDGKCICYQPYVGKNCNNCLDNYYGTNCSYKCTNSFCKNSKCNEDGTCKECIIGYEGRNCDQCNKFYKKINNKCILNTNLSEICQLPDYGLSISDNKYGMCLSCPKNNYGLVCSNHGYCNGKGTVFGDGKCNCFNNYTGSLCDNHGMEVSKEMCNNSCSNNGVCLKYNNKYSCNCKKNYTGIDCNHCLVGYVKNKENKCYRCEQGSGYYGKYCQKCDCKNGICNDGFLGDGSCNCYNGFTGSNCDICKNNFYGYNCTKCSDCNNKGICVDGKSGDGRCICNFGYAGKYCDNCINGFIKNNYHCEECPGSYGGSQKECFGNGKCVIQNNKIKCLCNFGFSGKSCSEKIKSNCSDYDYCNFNGDCIDNECYCRNNLYGDYCNETYISYLKKYNKSNFYATESYIVEESKIENSKSKQKIDSGNAIGISILSVFLFIGCIVGSGFYIKYRPNPIRRFSTSLTASRKIELTEDEKKYCTNNPILKIDDKNNKFLAKSINNLRIAVEKDNDHYFEEAIKHYDIGIDNLVHYLKTVVNSNDRFQIAKRVDIYLKRVNYLKRVIQNKELINEIQKAPLAPVIES